MSEEAAGIQSREWEVKPRREKEEDLKGLNLTWGKDWLNQQVRGHHPEPSKGDWEVWRHFPGWGSSLGRSIKRGLKVQGLFLSNFIKLRMLWVERIQRSAIPTSPPWPGIFFFFQFGYFHLGTEQQTSQCAFPSHLSAALQKPNFSINNPCNTITNDSRVIRGSLMILKYQTTFILFFAYG